MTGSSGRWAEAALAPIRAGRWTAHDDQGRSYRGAATNGSGSVGVVHKDLSFTRAADATKLTVELPSAIDGQGRTATLDLRAEPTSNSR